MDFTALAREIGIVELSRSIDACADANAKAQAARYLPGISAGRLQEALQTVATGVMTAPWQQVLLLTPETALVELLAQARYPGKLVVCIPREVDELAAQRIVRNVPDGIDVSFIKEGAFPAGFLPGKDAMLALGCGNAQRTCLPASTVRMLEYYASFAGERVLGSLGAAHAMERPLGWVERSTTDLFNALIGGEESIS